TPTSSLMKTNWSTLDDIVQQLVASIVNYSLKVGIFNDEDGEYAKYVYERYKQNNNGFFVSVGIEESDVKEDISPILLRQLDWLLDKVLNDEKANGFKSLPQLHTLVYANRRRV